MAPATFLDARGVSDNALATDLPTCCDGFVMSSIERTITLATGKPVHATGQRSLVQIHPLDLNRGPIALAKEVTTLGRSSSCDLQICDDAVSRAHAEIRLSRHDCVLLDLESTNGIAVNGSKAARHTLSSGDCIQIGSHVFRFLADDDLETQYHETVYAMMTRDGMTGVYNKRYLEETLEREVARCRRYGRPISVIVADVDYFKAINDSYGHAVGDQVLTEIAQRLSEVLRVDDVLARLGGEEFAIVMVEAGLEQTVEIAERCRLAIEAQPISATVGEIQATVSLGIAAPAPPDLATGDELLADADARMYEAKRCGRNRCIC